MALSEIKAPSDGSRPALTRAVSAGWPWLVAVLLGILIVNRVPLTGQSLLDATVELHKRLYSGGQMVHVYSGVQGRPTETCDTFLGRQDETLRAIAAAVKAADPDGSVAGVGSTVRVFDQRIRELFLSKPDESCWKEFNDYAYFQGGFPSDAPFIWVFRNLGLSTVHVALALILGSWAGLVCMFLIAHRLTGSHLAGLATVFLNSVVWRYWHFPEGAYLYILNCFVPIYLGMVLASPIQAQARFQGASRVLAEAALIGIFAAHALLQAFIYPFTHRVNGMLIIISVLAVGALRSDRRVLVRGIALMIAVNVVASPYYREMNGFYHQLTTQNLAANEGFVEAQMAMGLYERPTYLGLPNGDYGFTWMHAIDPYLYYTAPNLIVHQAFKYFGTTIMPEVLLTSPLTAASAIVKRLFIQTAYHHHLFFWWYDPADTHAQLRYTSLAGAFVLFVVGCIWSVKRSRRWAAWWPIAAIILWHLLGINTILTIVHTHDHYVISGVIVLLTLLPALAMFAVRDVLAGRGEADSAPSVLARIATRWPVRPWKIAVAAALSVLVLAPTLVREARKEIDVFWLWYPIHVIANPSKNFDRQLWRSPSEMAERVTHLDSLGHASPGSNQMYAAWVFWVYNNQNALFRRGPATNDLVAQERFKGEAQSYMLESYRAALRAAPDNPNFASYALMLNAPEWPDVFRRAIEKWPTYHHSAYMAYHMIAQARSPEERSRFIKVYEEGVGATLSSSSAGRPGYQALPRVTPAGFVSAADPSGLEVTLRADEHILLDPIALEGAPKIRIGLFVQVKQGQLQVGAETATGQSVASCTTFAAFSGDPQHYRYVDCSRLEGVSSLRLGLKAVGPTVVVIRDYYPLFSIVRTPPP